MEEKSNIPTKKKKTQTQQKNQTHVICNLQDCKTSVIFEREKKNGNFSWICTAATIWSFSI